LKVLHQTPKSLIQGLNRASGSFATASFPRNANDLAGSPEVYRSPHALTGAMHAAVGPRHRPMSNETWSEPA
jgi:hypothetical protein